MSLQRCLDTAAKDGQSLASPGRWPPGSRVYPSSKSWTSVVDCILRFTHHHGTEQLLVSLAMGKIDACPFPPDDVAQLKESVISAAAGFGHQIERRPGDRSDVPIDYRFFDLCSEWLEILRPVSESTHRVTRWDLGRGCRDCLCCLSPRKMASRIPSRSTRLSRACSR